MIKIKSRIYFNKILLFFALLNSSFAYSFPQSDEIKVKCIGVIYNTNPNSKTVNPDSFFIDREAHIIFNVKRGENGDSSQLYTSGEIFRKTNFPSIIILNEGKIGDAKQYQADHIRWSIKNSINHINTTNFKEELIVRLSNGAASDYSFDGFKGILIFFNKALYYSSEDCKRLPPLF